MLEDFDALGDAALDSARGASHCDVRLVRTRTGYSSRRDRAPMAEIDHTATGFGVRALCDGAWGFAATDDLSLEAAADAGKRAAAMARTLGPGTTELVAEPVYRGSWSSSFEQDPFTADRQAFLREGCDALLAHDAVSRADAMVMAVHEVVAYADSSGTRTTQARVRMAADFTAVHVASDGSFESMRTTVPPQARGWEFTASEHWRPELEAIPDWLAEKAQAPSVEPGRYTLVLAPSNLWLTIHESVGHATELDRILGYEANYAGTSFVRAGDVGSLRYGSPLMTVRADRTAPFGLATVGWDDDGVAAQEWNLITDGILTGLQLDRSMASRTGAGRSNGCAYADSGLHVPIQRMPNVSLMPDPRGGSLDDLVAGVEDGILVVGDNSWSIDMQRYNFQFTGQRFERIRAGRRVGQVKDVAYQGSTPGFWQSLAALGGPQSYVLGGAFNCGKGQPGQVAAVSHGCPPAVFEGVNVLNTNREAGPESSGGSARASGHAGQVRR